MKDHKHQFFSLPVSVIEQLIKKEVLVPVTSGESYRKLKEPALEYCPKSGIVQVIGTDDRLYVNSIKIEEFLRSARALRVKTEQKQPTPPTSISCLGYEVACLFQNASAAMTPEDYVKIMAILSPVTKEQVVFSVNEEDVSVNVAGMIIKIAVDRRLRNALVKEIALKKEVAEKQKAFRQKHSGATKQANAASADNAMFVDLIEQNLGDRKPEAYYIRKDDYYGIINYVLLAKFEQGGIAPMAFSDQRADLTQLRNALEEKLFG